MLVVALVSQTLVQARRAAASIGDIRSGSDLTDLQFPQPADKLRSDPSSRFDSSPMYRSCFRRWRGGRWKSRYCRVTSSGPERWRPYLAPSRVAGGNGRSSLGVRHFHIKGLERRADRLGVWAACRVRARILAFPQDNEDAAFNGARTEGTQVARVWVVATLYSSSRIQQRTPWIITSMTFGFLRPVWIITFKRVVHFVSRYTQDHTLHQWNEAHA